MERGWGVEEGGFKELGYRKEGGKQGTSGPVIKT